MLAGLARLRRHGTGATRQRLSHRRTAVLAEAAREQGERLLGVALQRAQRIRAATAGMAGLRVMDDDVVGSGDTAQIDPAIQRRKIIGRPGVGGGQGSSRVPLLPSAVTVVRSTVPTSRHSSSAPAEPTTADPDTLHRGASLPVAATMTGADGTVLVTISRHTEHPVPQPTGSSTQTPLVVVDVVGEIDADTAALLHSALTSAVRRHRRVCCDLSRVAFLGAAGVNTILDVLHTADNTGCVFTVRGVHGISARVFQITGLDAVLAARA